MTKKALEARRAYQREWNRNHPEAVKRHQETYWEKRAKQAETQKEGEQPGNDKDS